MDLDLNLDNYELADLLNLFKLDFDFNEHDLKQVKKMVLNTHPDKSPHLEKEYFLFFSEAYKIIYSVYQFRHKSTNKNSTYNTEYILEKDEEKEALLSQMKSKPNFNKIFNELFDQYKIKDNDAENGYGDWLKSEEDIDYRTTTLTTMNETFHTKKKEIQAIIKMNDYEEFGGSSSHYDLTRDKPECYSSGLFSSLGYEDLKKAHVESVIPVTHEDYLRRPKYNTVEELQRSSDYQNIIPLSQTQAKEYLEQRNYNESKNDVQRAFKLAKQDEEARKANDGWMSRFKTLQHF
jgi:hypothetical protein